MKKHLFINKGMIVIALLLTAVMAYACGVDVDIKPGSEQNKVNPDSHGRVKVAILTTPSFDATAVKEETIRFGKLTRSEGAPVVNYQQTDVDNDGDIDNVLQFEMDQTGIEAGDTNASVRGETDEGDTFSGEDIIVTVGN